MIGGNVLAQSGAGKDDTGQLDSLSAADDVAAAAKTATAEAPKTPAPDPGAPSSGQSGIILSTVASIVTQFLLWLARLFISITLFLLTFVIQIAGYNGYLDSRP